MKGWLVGLTLMVVLVASGVGLWITWDSTQTTTAGPLVASNRSALIPPTTDVTSPSTTTVPAPPPCTPGDEVVTADPSTEWATIAIDPGHRLPETYAPIDLVSVAQAGFGSEDQVRAIVIDDLAALRAGAEANGTPIVVISGYRSFVYQQTLFQRSVDEAGEAAAALTTARPGHSEHQLGTVVDVLDPGVGELTPEFALTPAGQWIAAHAHEYGFVVSYPEGANDRSCYEFEPWHLRYVGRDVAASIHESGLTPREWMIASRANAPA